MLDDAGIQEATQEVRVLVEIANHVLHALGTQPFEQFQPGAYVDLQQAYRRVVEEMPVALLAALQCRIGLLVRRDIHQRAHQLRVAQFIRDGMGDDMKVLDRSVRQ